MSSPGNVCFDIFSPAPGDSDVINHFEWLSSNEMKIARRSVRIVAGVSAITATTCMIASRVNVQRPPLPRHRQLSTP